MQVFKAAYDVLHTYMIGNSRKNALYFAKYIDFFQTQFSVKVSEIQNGRFVLTAAQRQHTDDTVKREHFVVFLSSPRGPAVRAPLQGDIGLNVAQMIVELIRDNRKIVDRITRQQIDEFISLLRCNKVRDTHTHIHVNTHTHTYIKFICFLKYNKLQSATWSTGSELRDVLHRAAVEIQ